MGYQIVGGATGTLEAFKSLSDVGLIYIDTHGLISSGEVSLQSGTKVSQEQDALLAAELNNKELFYLSPDSIPAETCYAFTSTWAKKNIRLAPGAFVFLNSCYGQGNPTMSDALAGNGMRAMVGWTSMVDDDLCADSARFFFDQAGGEAALFEYTSSGSSLEEPTGALVWTGIVDKMRNTTRIRGNTTLTLAQSSRNNCRILTSGTSNSLGTLRPVISSVVMNELENRTNLSGIFGVNPGTVSAITSDGVVSIPVTSWEFNSISTPFLRDASKIFVTVNGVRSDEYEIGLETYRLMSQSGGAIILKNEVTIWVSGTEVYNGSGVNVGPIEFQGVPGARSRIQVRRTGSASGSVAAFIDSPIALDYQVVPAEIDLLIPGVDGIVWDYSYFLQP